MTVSTTIRVVVIEDQPAILSDIQTLMEQQAGFMVVGACTSVKEAVVVIPATRPDLLLLDISLLDGTGFEILEKIKPITPKVIFITAYQEHAIRAIKYGALDYLLKPLDQYELKNALNKILRSQPVGRAQLSVAKQQYDEGSNRIILTTQQYLEVVELNDIVYCQSDKGYTSFFLTADRKIVTSKYLKEYESLLPSKQFFRTHQSYLVNRDFIEKYRRDNGYLILKNGFRIPVSFRRREELVEFLKRIPKK